MYARDCVRVERLLYYAAVEVLDGWKKVENAVVSLSSVGLSVDSEAARDAQAAVSAAQAFIVDLFPAVMVTLRSEDEDVRLSVVPFLQAYANKLKSGLKRQNALPAVRSLLALHVDPSFNVRV